ncbi:MAG: cell division protein FtsW [Gemmatimonadota bacterium]
MTVPMAARTAPAASRDRWRMSLEARALTFVSLALVCVGLAVLYSASALQAVSKGSPGHFFVLRQAMGVVVGGAAFMVAAKLDAERWRTWAWPIMLGSLLMMLVIVLPGTEAISQRVYGSRRYLFNGSIQPSEFAKVAILIWVPMLLVKKGQLVREVGRGLMPFVTVVGAQCILAALEPDLSVAMMFCGFTAVLLFIGGARISHFVLFSVAALLLLGAVSSKSTYVRARVTGFFESDGRTKDSAVNDQQYQSLVAVGSGGLVGVGIGQGNQQRGWLPLAYNDFIGSIIGEEFGFLGMASIVFLFALYGWLGFRIARHARSPYLSLLAVGLTMSTVVTALIHIGVVMRYFPNTGLTLPFVSYGRSNLVLTLLTTGILVNIGSERERVYGTKATDPLAVASR